MKEIEDITEAAQMLAKIYEELKEINENSKEYLEEFLKENEEAQEHYPTLKEYDNCVSALGEAFYYRIYDLAIYNLTSRLLDKYTSK